MRRYLPHATIALNLLVAVVNPSDTISVIAAVTAGLTATALYRRKTR